MSIQAVAWVLEHSKAKLADRLVLIAIANHADARGWNAWPSIERIADEAGVHQATVTRSVKTLELLGELIVERRPGRANRYGIRALHPPQSAGGNPPQFAGGPPANDAKTPRRLRPEPSVTVKEPTPAPIEYDPNTLERDATGNWFVRSSTPVPRPVTQTTMPPELPEETRAKGAQWARALRRGSEPDR